MTEKTEIPPLNIDPQIIRTPSGEYGIRLIITTPLAQGGGIWQILPFLFPKESDAVLIANRTLKYYAMHGVAPNFDNPLFRSEDEKVALATPPA